MREMIKMINEIWKSIKDYEGLYEVSSIGRVRSLDHFRKNGTNGYLQKGKILKPSITGDGYWCVALSKNGKAKNFKIHRLMAVAFFDNFNNKLVINHKDGDKLNNVISNLELCTQSHNIKEAIRLGTKKPPCLGKFGKEHHRSKAINQYDLQGNFIREWECSMQVQRELGISQNGVIQCCKERRKTAGGFVWKYKKEVKRK